MQGTSTNLESEIYKFAKTREWDVVHGQNGSAGSYWIKEGRFRMLSIEPKRYGWLIGIGNSLFRDLDNIQTCRLNLPAGEHRWDKHKRTKNFWKVTELEDLLVFLGQ